MIYKITLEFSKEDLDSLIPVLETLDTMVQYDLIHFWKSRSGEPLSTSVIVSKIKHIIQIPIKEQLKIQGYKRYTDKRIVFLEKIIKESN